MTENLAQIVRRYNSFFEYSYYDFIFFLDVDDCEPNPCQNDGTCTDGINSYSCNCAHGYAGDNCELGIDLFCLISLKMF